MGSERLRNFLTNIREKVLTISNSIRTMNGVKRINIQNFWVYSFIKTN